MAGDVKLAELLSSHSDRLQETLTLEEYVNKAVANPHLSERAHARLYRMIQSHGVEADEGGNVTRWKFFDGEIYGLEREKRQIMEYLRSAAAGGDTRKRVLMLVGPVATGKSSMAALLKRRLEAWTRTEAGAVYAIEGCPLREDPLHLLPGPARETLRAQWAINIQGELCPHCRVRLQEEWEGDPTRARVVRVTFSEADRLGIGTFVASDPKSQFVEELLGSVNLATVGKYGGDSDPRAYRFDGEMQVANRGVLEMIEGLKCKRELLLPLLTAAQEQNIKLPRYGLIDVDEFVLLHTNETEFQAFWSDSKNEALRDRFIVVSIPYNLRISDEESIYAKIVKESGTQGHVAPDTLRTAAMFSVLTRLQPLSNLEPVDKARLYDGELLEGWTRHRVKDELRDKAEREGMVGISPRFVANAIARAMSRPGATCASALDVMRALRESIEAPGAFSPAEREELLNHLARTRKWFDERLVKTVSRAFVSAFGAQSKAIVDRYLTEISAWKAKDKMTDPITGDLRDPDEKFMRSIEEHIGIADPAKKEFREEILFRVGQMAVRGERFELGSHPRLRDAVERYLFAHVRPMMKTLVRIQTPDAEQRRKIDEVQQAMREEGFCGSCAADLLRYCGSLLDV